MIVVYVELSGESPELAAEEAVAGAEALGGRRSTSEDPLLPGLHPVRVPERSAARALAARLGLGRRTVVPVDPGSTAPDAARSLPRGTTVAVRRLGRPTSGAQDDGVLAVGAAFVASGWAIDLDRPNARFWVVADASGTDRLVEEVGAADRSAFTARRMPHLPFQRPISLDPRLARAAANLARIRTGDRVLDPFLGTGALLAEAGLLGGELWGIDADPAMVRGALRNFAHLGLVPRSLVEGDAGSVDPPDRPPTFDAILTDPPYGRSSPTGGEDAAALVARVLPRWADRLRPGGRLVVVVPGGPDPVAPPWRRVLSVPVRVHRSLTREFRVYER